MAAHGKLPIMESARAGFTFMRASLRTVAPAAVMFSAVAALSAIAAPPPGAAPGAGAVSLLLTVVSVMFGLGYTAFLYRLALRNDASGYFGLKIGKDESNLLGATLVVGFFFMIIAVLGIVIFSIAMMPAAEQANVDLRGIAPDDEAAVLQAFGEIFKGPGAPYLITLGAALGAFAIWLSLRLFLVNVATIAEGRIMAFSTWSWTKGDTLHILAAALVVIFPIALPIGLGVGVLGAALGFGVAGAAIVTFLQALAQNLFLVPALAGLSAFLYRGLRPPEVEPPKPAQP
ncbi:MAG: hypothetical protein WDN76_13055 [Alphaproteobacteria bacterium]